MDTLKNRDEILKNLRICSFGPETALSSEFIRTPVEDISTLYETFQQNLVVAAGNAHRVESNNEALQKIDEILTGVNASSIALSGDDVISSLGVRAYFQGRKIIVRDLAKSMDEHKNISFTVDAGITGADYAIADTGTVAIVHNRNNPRLISLAPPTHIVILPIHRLLPDIDTVIAEINPGTGEASSAISLITGPSMTADIALQATYGMHGPKVVEVIFVG
jgi:L-lactate dehydrogenase complex protein LldG